MVKNKVVLVLVILAVSFFFVYFIGKFSTEKADHTLKISEVLSASIYLAEKAGRIVHDFRLNDKNVNLQIEHKQGYKGNKELVTEADKRSNEVIINGLSLLWPSLQLRSEERSIKEKQTLSHADVPPLVNAQLKDVTKNDDIVNLKDVTIWIDPLDATKEYAEVKPELLKYVTVMVCVAVKEKAVASVIYQPFVKDKNGKLGITYWSWVNHGTSDNIHTYVKSNKHNKSPNVMKVITSRSHPGNVKKVFNNAFKGEKIKHEVAAGAGYKALQVALGNADVYFHTTSIKKWDICAGDALISAIGGIMTTRKGKNIDYKLFTEPHITDGLITAKTATLHKKILNKLKV